MKNTHKTYAFLILIAFGLGLLVLILTIHTSFSIPCLFRQLTGIPCPACGLTSSFVLASRLDAGAVISNILFLPLAAGMATYLACAILDAFFGKTAINRLNALLGRWWVILIAVLLTVTSWYLNISRLM